MYDIAPDGKRFLLVKQSVEASANAGRIILVENWVEELTRLVPVN